jgi:hypothetical protein
MRSGRMARRLVATAGMGAILAMGVLSACAKEAPAPEKVTVTETVTATAPPPPATPAPPPPAPTEKSINPTGGNLFTPPVLAPPAPTEPPGVHRNK